jgi:hypothetical protein
MVTLPSVTISPVLREAAELTIDELNRGKEAFKKRFLPQVRPVPELDTFTRVTALLDDIAKLRPELNTVEDLEIVAHYVRQGMEDGSVSDSKVLQFEEQIGSDLVKHLNRLELSSLHIELLVEAIDGAEDTASFTKKRQSADLDDDFEVVENDLDQALESFEKQTFTAKDVDVEELETFLSEQVSATALGSPIDSVRHEMKTFGEGLLADGVDIDQDLLLACIVELLKSDLVENDKKRTLESYLQSPIALRELVAALDMKSLRHWEYRNVSRGLNVAAKKDCQGTYHILIEESIIDMLFLHIVGIASAMKLKRCLKDFIRDTTPIPPLSVDELAKRDYFLGYQPEKITESHTSMCTACHPHYSPMHMPPPPPPPLCTMPPPPPPPPVCIMPPPPPSPPYFPLRLKSKKKPKSSFWPSGLPCPPPQPHWKTIASMRHNQYTREYFMSRLPIQNGCTPKITPSEEVQANLIKILAAETKLRKAFDGQAYTGYAQFRSLAASLPHQTILTVLKFIGVPEALLEFFERFLSANINIGSAVRGGSDRILSRARGVPEGHALELFFSEAIMFFLEIAVHQNTHSYLYRLNDSCYFVGNRDQHHAYENQVAKFAKALGLTVTVDTVQSIGLLSMNAQGMTIESSKVSLYAHSVKKQLDACTTVLDWVRVWNDTAGTYAPHLFGPIANVFGKPLLAAVKEAYKSVFEIVLGGTDLTSYVKRLLITHMEPFQSPPPHSLEAFMYLPQAYGGLGVKNPMITISIAHKLPDTSDAIVAAYLLDEEKYYQSAANNYATLTPNAHVSKIEALFANDKTRIDDAMGADRDLTVFMTMEELTARRERVAYPQLYMRYPMMMSMPLTIPQLENVYTDLLREPKDDITRSDKVSDEVARLSHRGDMKPWRSLSREDKWVVQLYSNECFEGYGGLEIWCSESVPQEALKMVRGGSLDEGDGDDASSVSDMTEP